MTTQRRLTQQARSQLANLAREPKERPATRITTSSTGGKTTYIVWEQCPISGIYQTVSTHETMDDAQKEPRI